MGAGAVGEGGGAGGTEGGGGLAFRSGAGGGDAGAPSGFAVGVEAGARGGREKFGGGFEAETELAGGVDETGWEGEVATAEAGERAVGGWGTLGGCIHVATTGGVDQVDDLALAGGGGGEAGGGVVHAGVEDGDDDAAAVVGGVGAQEGIGPDLAFRDEGGAGGDEVEGGLGRRRRGRCGLRESGGREENGEREGDGEGKAEKVHGGRRGEEVSSG